MGLLKNMPVPGLVVIFVIAALFVVAVALLCRVYFGYRRISELVNSGDPTQDEFLRRVLREFTAAYRVFGENTNTPGIIENVMGSGLSGLLFCERFLNNSVSIFVTLGLFGTFLGLSLSVASLTNLISYSNTSEWLSVLDSVGGGLMSALSGMGVAFYTSLVGAGCSILLTVLRTVFSPQSQREKLSTQLELWLDHTVAPTLATEAEKDEAKIVKSMIDAMNKTADSMDKAMRTSADDMKRTLEGSKPYLVAFHQTVEKFNGGVRDFSEVDYNLRGTVERLDVAIRDLTRALRQVSDGNGEQR